MKKKLTDQSQKLMELLLTEPKIAEAVFADIENREIYKILDINEDGSLTLGKRSVRWWNKLFGLERTISFRDFAFCTLRALSGMAANLNKNTILQGLSRELIAKAVLEEKFDFVVDRLFDVARFATEDGRLNTVATPANGKVMPEPPVEHVDRDVRVVLENKGWIPIRDSVGKVLLNLRVKVDGYSIERD
jgi:hypothetical protein